VRYILKSINCKKFINIYFIKIKIVDMKYLKKFENFDMGRFSDVSPEEELVNTPKEIEDTEESEEKCQECGCSCTDCECGGGKEEEEKESEEENRSWGDEVNNPLMVEGKKSINAGFQAYLDKQKAKKEDKKVKSKAKPDFLDLDKDGDKEESMKKAAKEAKSKEKETKKK
jgi:hypothetical protein